jgi:hypothetical protein
MLIKILAFLVIIAMFIGGSFVIPSCEVDNSPVNNTQHTHPDKTKYNNCTSFGVVVLKDIGSIGRTYEHEVTALSTFGIFFFTIVLAVAGGLQYCAIMASIREARRSSTAQAILTRRSIEAAETSANAARLSAEAMVTVERAELSESVIESDIEGAYWSLLYDNSSAISPTSERNLSVSMRIKNYGKTPGTVFDVFTDIRIDRRVPEIKNLDFVSDELFSERTIPTGEERGPINTCRNQAISWQQSQELIRGTANIYFIGRFIFDDIFHTTWVRDFIWEYRCEGRRWNPIHSQTSKGKQTHAPVG